MPIRSPTGRSSLLNSAPDVFGKGARKAADDSCSDDLEQVTVVPGSRADMAVHLTGGGRSRYRLVKIRATGSTTTDLERYPAALHHRTGIHGHRMLVADIRAQTATGARISMYLVGIATLGQA